MGIVKDRTTHPAAGKWLIDGRFLLSSEGLDIGFVSEALCLNLVLKSGPGQCLVLGSIQRYVCR